MLYADFQQVFSSGYQLVAKALGIYGFRMKDQQGDPYEEVSAFHVWIKIAINGLKLFVIQITIYTFVALRCWYFRLRGLEYISDPEEDLKVKSFS